MHTETRPENHTQVSWFSFLDRMTLSGKFILMLVFPILGLSFFSISGVLEKTHTLNQATASQELAKFAVLSSSLVHETQKERGMTAGFLGSKGKQFASQLIQQRRDATDPKIDELHSFLESFEGDIYGTDFSALLELAIKRVNGLNTIRQKVDRQELAMASAIGYYTQMHAAFLDAIGFISKLSSDAKMATLNIAYINFLQGKERAGIERAVLTNTFARGSFAVGMYQKFSALVIKQEVYFDNFLAIAQPEQIAIYHHKMSSPEVAEVERIRTIAFQSGAASRLYILLGELYQNMALRGVYHSVKNLLIRGSHYGKKNYQSRPDMQSKYKKQFEKNYQAIESVIERILLLSLQELNDQQRQDVEVVWHNVKAYRQSIAAIIQQQSQGKHLQDIDHNKADGIKINDKPADLAIRRLVKSTAVGHFGIDSNHWFKTITTKIVLLKDVENELNRAITNQAEQLKQQSIHELLVNISLTVFNIVAALLIAFMVGRKILGKLGGEPEYVNRLIQRIATGDLTGRCHYEDMAPATGILAAMNDMTVELCQMLRGLSDVSNDLRHASSELDSVAGGISNRTTVMQDRTDTVAVNVDIVNHDMKSVASATEQTGANLNSVSASSQQADANLQTIAAAAEEASINLGTVATAAEEANTSMILVRQAAERTSGNVDVVATSIQGMTSSLADVRTRCESASQSSKQASQHAKSSIGVMEKLAASAQEIDSVVSVINNIAEQTNMLALNASIEAAGAGDAGKGFAVVANEVKELARQTGDATRMILEKIQTIQTHTQEVATVTSSVTKSIQHIDQSNQDILYSVGEQERSVDKIVLSMERVAGETSEVTRLVGESADGITAVTRNVTELSQGINEVTRNVTQAAAGVSDMSRNMIEVSQASSEIADKVVKTAQASTEISISVDDVKEAADSIRDMSTTVTGQSETMTKLSSQLADMLGKFRT